MLVKIGQMEVNEGDRTGPYRSRPTRGFLFADLRAYTTFVEVHGDAAAADLLTSFRLLVRDVVQHYGGAEIKTEGDSFYVVFPGAGDAVRCGLAIVAAAAAATKEQPAHPIGVGVGVHAGESAETADGYVGSAVNIAARLCAQAGVGEVLVSDTLRGLIRTSADIAFVARGRRHLKGIAEPLAVYAARPVVDKPGMPGATPSQHRRSRRPLLLAALFGGLVIALGAGWSVIGLGAFGPHTTRSTDPTGVAIASPELTSTPTLATSATAAAFPDAAEAALLASLPKALAGTCSRGPYDVVSGDRSAAPLASLRCPQPFGSGATEVLIRRFRDPGLVTGTAFSTDSVLSNIATRERLGEGDCATTSRADGRWQLAGVDAGSIACLSDASTGDAVLWWSYKTYQVLVKATNGSGDSKALYGFFTQTARFISP